MFFKFAFAVLIGVVAANIAPRQNSNCDLIPAELEVKHAKVPSKFCPYFWAQNLKRPRGMLTVSNGDVLVVERDLGQVTVLWDADKRGYSKDNERAKLAAADGLNHGVEVGGGFLYASSSTTVYRWKYTPGDRKDLGTGEVVVKNVPCCHHVTRTLRFQPDGKNLLVQVGSKSNVDQDSLHARVKSFDVSTTIPAGGIDWDAGSLYADGLRNEVGLRYDHLGRLWGVENGVDNLNRPDLGGDIHETNPAEEMNLLHPAPAENKGGFFGYPFCWSSYKLPPPHEKVPKGTQYYQPDLGKTDAWCQSVENVVPPAWNFGAHQAPMDILFFNQANNYPQPFAGGAYVSFHGSWNRNPPAGYRVLHVTMGDKGEQKFMPLSDTYFLEGDGAGATTDWPHRPVGLSFGTCFPFGGSNARCLLISSDASGVIMAMGYNTNGTNVISKPTTTTNTWKSPPAGTAGAIRVGSSLLGLVVAAFFLL